MTHPDCEGLRKALEDLAPFIEDLKLLCVLKMKLGPDAKAMKALDACKAALSPAPAKQRCRCGRERFMGVDECLECQEPAKPRAPALTEKEEWAQRVVEINGALKYPGGPEQTELCQAAVILDALVKRLLGQGETK
jgi:hypothetical protein